MGICEAIISGYWSDSLSEQKPRKRFTLMVAYKRKQVFRIGSMLLSKIFNYLAKACVSPLGHSTLSLPVATDNIVTRMMVETSAI